MKNFSGFINRLNTSKERISEFKDRPMKLPKQKKREKKEWKQTEQSIWELWYFVEQPNIHVIEIPEGEEITKQKKYLKR